MDINLHIAIYCCQTNLALTSCLYSPSQPDSCIHKYFLYLIVPHVFGSIMVTSDFPACRLKNTSIAYSSIDPRLIVIPLASLVKNAVLLSVVLFNVAYTP
jgi:hypothetical protein